MKRSKPYLFTSAYVVSCIAFCISALKIAGTGYLEMWEAVMAASALAWGYFTRVLYDYARGVQL